MMIRISKIMCVTAVALYCTLAALGNLTDYYANFPGVERALMMKELLPGSTIGYRAITNPLLQHLAFIIIISFESLSAILCVIGAFKLFRARGASTPVFNHAKSWAIGGLTCGFLTWQVLFMSVAGEWFGLWMSHSLQGALTSAFQIYMTLLAVLIYVVIKDE